MTAFARRAIVVERADRAAVFRGHLAQSVKVFVLVGVVIAACVVVATLNPDGVLSSVGGGFIVAALAVLIVVVALLVWTHAVSVRRQLPLGAEVSVQVTDETLDLDAPGSSERIRWRLLSNPARTKTAVFFTVAPSNVRIGLPARVVGDAEFEVIAERIANTVPADDLAAAPPTEGEGLRAAIVVTAADQRVAARTLRRASAAILLPLVALMLLGLGAAVAGAIGILPDAVTGYAAGVAVLALLAVVVLLNTQAKTVKGVLPLGSEQTLTLTDEALELTGPGGVTRLPWHRLENPRRRGNAVTVRSLPTKTTLVFVGRLVDDQAYAIIEARAGAGASSTAR